MSFDKVMEKLGEIDQSHKSVFVGFSFNVIDSQYFWGRNHHFLKSCFNAKTCLILFKYLAKMENLKSLQFYDFNPQNDDY